MTQGKKFFTSSVEAIKILGWRAILLTPHPAQLPELDSEDILYAPYIPFNKLFPHVAALVHHGGIGTLAQALAAAVPQLIVSFAFDQPDNAYRLEALGAGLALTQQDYTISSAIEKLQYLVNSEKIKAACQQYAKKIDFKMAEQNACALIEKLEQNH